jgi:hypothetical protein
MYIIYSFLYSNKFHGIISYFSISFIIKYETYIKSHEMLNIVHVLSIPLHDFVFFVLLYLESVFPFLLLCFPFPLSSFLVVKLLYAKFYNYVRYSLCHAIQFVVSGLSFLSQDFLLRLI